MCRQLDKSDASRKDWTLRTATFVFVLALAMSGCGGDDDASDMATDGATRTRAGSAEYPEPDPANLEKPFTGKAVPDGWLGRWEDRLSGAEWVFFAAESPECRSITAGRTTCFANGPPGSTATDPASLYSAGAITYEGDSVILRMTYTPSAGGVSCFEDDGYRFRFTSERMTLLMGGGKHCFYEPGEADAAAKAGRISKNALTEWTRAD